MKIFKNINKEGSCAICGKNTDGEVVLIHIDGTEDGGNVQCEQVHVTCLNLRMTKIKDGNDSIIYQIFEETK